MRYLRPAIASAAIILAGTGAAFAQGAGDPGAMKIVEGRLPIHLEQGRQRPERLADERAGGSIHHELQSRRYQRRRQALECRVHVGLSKGLGS